MFFIALPLVLDEMLMMNMLIFDAAWGFDIFCPLVELKSFEICCIIACEGNVCK